LSKSGGSWNACSSDQALRASGHVSAIGFPFGVVVSFGFAVFLFGGRAFLVEKRRRGETFDVLWTLWINAQHVG
jgi:hypothetical protein